VDQVAVAKPVPVADEESAAFWEGAARHELRIQRCARCGWYAHPPRLICASCQSLKPEFHSETVSGRGRVRTWTVIRSAFLPGFAPDVPYSVIEVELDEQPGLRLLARRHGEQGPQLAIGARAEIVFDDVAPGISIPRWRLVAQR
jgi:uncharacterized OB-fold protein